jgi:CubicO group peptidase (beta-lactamase class C family)
MLLAFIANGAEGSSGAARLSRRLAVARYQGHVEPGYEAVARLFTRVFRSPRRGGGSFVVRYRDRNVVDLWGGVADPSTGRRWERDSLGLSFSTTKGVTATVIHRLADRGLLGYDEPVAQYWPEFAAGGKSRLTVRQLLTHQLGLDRLAPIAPDTAALLDHLGAERRLAAHTPDHEPGSPAYHAITFGWLCAGLARALTGKGMAELVRTELAEPLGVDGLHIGRPATGRERVPASIGTFKPLSPVLARLAAVPMPGVVPLRRGLEALFVPGSHEVFQGPEPRVLDTEMPAANGMFTAESLAVLYGALANDGVVDGRRLLSGATVRALSRVQTTAPDRALGIPMRWRLGYHQAYVPGVWLPRAFGHYGYAGSGAWADPVSGMSVAFVSNRIYPITMGLGDLALTRLSRLAVAAARRIEGPASALPRPAAPPADHPDGELSAG